MEDETKQIKFTTPELIVLSISLQTMHRAFKEEGSLLAGYAEKLVVRLDTEIGKREDKFESFKFIFSMDPHLQTMVGPISDIERALEKIKNAKNKFKSDEDNN